MTKYNSCSLDNGLRIIHLPSTSQVVWCGYDLAVGSRDELPGEEGLAHFCEHMTFKGTQRRDALQIINSLESVGGELNAFTNKEDTVFYAAVTKDHFAKAVNLLTDIVFHSLYPQHEIDKEVEVICDEIESWQAEQLRTYTTEDVLSFAQRHYRLDNAVFFVYGDIDFRRLCSILRKEEREMRKENTPAAESLGTNMSLSSFLFPPSSKILEKGTHQAHVMIGTQAYRYDDPRRMTLYLLNNIIGGPGMNAWLNLSLRERHGLVYTVESSMASYSDMGVWCVYFGCDHHDVNRCLRLVRHVLDRMMQRQLSASQLSIAKRQLKGQLVVACDNREQFALDFGRCFLHHGHERDLDALLGRIDSVTAEDIQKVASELFFTDHLTTLMIK